MKIKSTLHNYLLLSQYAKVLKAKDFGERFVAGVDIAEKFQMNTMTKLFPFSAIPLLSAAFLADNLAVSIPCVVGAVIILLLWTVANSLLTTMQVTVFMYLTEMTRRDAMLSAMRNSWITQASTDEQKQEIEAYYDDLAEAVHKVCATSLKGHVEYL